MDHSTMGLELPRAGERYVFALGSLFVAFEELTVEPKYRGKRYALALVLVLLVLAKLCGRGQPNGIAQWARDRQEQLVKLLGLSPLCLLSANTYRWVLRDVVHVSELQAAVSLFLSCVSETGNS